MDRLSHAPAGDSLPCQDSNNCTEAGGEVGEISNPLQPSARKTAAALAWNVAHLVERFGIERVGFLTLTFAEKIVCHREAQKRWHSLRSHVLSKRYVAFMRVFERQTSGRIHYHALVVLPEGSDIRTGVDWTAIEKGDYRSAAGSLRREWAFWRQTAPAFGFGRTELLPVRSTGAAIASYVGKYISKHLDKRQSQDKGVRLVEYSRGWKQASVRFAWVSPGAWLWRAKVKAFADAAGAPTSGHLCRKFGAHWAYTLREVIMSIPLEHYPTVEHARRDGRHVAGLPPDAVDLHYSPALCTSDLAMRAEAVDHGRSNAGGMMQPLRADESGTPKTVPRGGGDSDLSRSADETPPSRPPTRRFELRPLPAGLPLQKRLGL